MAFEVMRRSLSAPDRAVILIDPIIPILIGPVLYIFVQLGPDRARGNVVTICCDPRKPSSRPSKLASPIKNSLNQFSSTRLRKRRPSLVSDAMSAALLSNVPSLVSRRKRQFVLWRLKLRLAVFSDGQPSTNDVGKPHWLQICVANLRAIQFRQ